MRKTTERGRVRVKRVYIDQRPKEIIKERNEKHNEGMQEKEGQREGCM